MRLNIRNGIKIGALTLIFSPASAAPAEAGAHQAGYSFGVSPYLPSVRLEELYGPVALEFAEALDKAVSFRTKTSFAKFFEEVKAQKYDIVSIQPFHYVKAARYGYRPLARESEPLSAVLMVPQDSRLIGLRDLKGKTVALPPASAAVSHLTKIALIEAGLVPDRDVTVRHFKEHESCLQQIFIGTADACGTSPAVVRNFVLIRSARLRVLAVTPAIPHVLFAVHERVPKADRDALERLILGWHKTEKGRQLLKRLGRKPFVPALDSDYDIVREYAKRLNLPE